MVETISTQVGSGLFWYLLVLANGISEGNQARSIKMAVSVLVVLVNATERVVADIQAR